VSDDEGPGRVLAVRALPGANCSSVGSVIDLLFATGVVAGALLVAVDAALAARADAPADDDPPEATDESAR
jgi:hypothetical protein